jgi:hypothetical protein
MKNMLKVLGFILIIVLAVSGCDNGNQNCADCGEYPCECITTSPCETCGEDPCECPPPCTHVFGDNWLLTTPAAYCVGNTHGNGIETLTCTLCAATITRLIPCLGTQGLTFYEFGGEYEVTGINTHVANVCIPDYRNGKPVVGIGYEAFCCCSGNKGILESVRIGVNVVYIGESAFDGCTSLENVIFAEGSQLETIGYYAFYGTAIISITIPVGVIEIDVYAFASCENLVTVTFAEGSQLETIGRHAFNGCTSLTSITIPEGITYIGFFAFHACTSLETVTILAETPPQLGDFAFYYYDDYEDVRVIIDGLTIRVPASSVTAYNEHICGKCEGCFYSVGVCGWSDYADLIVPIL